MGGGKVSLEIPDGWGEMQRESSAMLNYIDVTPANRVEAVNYDDIDDGDGDSIVVQQPLRMILTRETLLPLSMVGEPTVLTTVP